MLLFFVIAYWITSVAIGLVAAFRVKNTVDYALASRRLPLYIVTATVFATWFGSEAVLGIPATFLQEGIGGIVADPFGSSICLILVGLFFARPLYRMKLLTIGDFYRNKYGTVVETLTTLCIVASYLGWVAAQIAALGVVFNVISEGMISQELGMLIGASTVLLYTMKGGMWSIAITDTIQMTIIVLGLLYIGWDVSETVGGVGVVVKHAIDSGKLSNFFPEYSWANAVGFFAAMMTMMLGSIPQQDIFQRIACSNSEKVAGLASILGGVLYFCFAFIPIFLAYSAVLIDPEMVQSMMKTDADSQLILPYMILKYTPILVQVIFFGALLSAIKGCTSATLLAPSIIFTENILRPAFGHLGDRRLLHMMRAVTVCFTILVTLFAIYSNSTIYSMVEGAYKIPLVSAFVPLVFGLYWKQANRAGAVLSIIFGLAVWLSLEMLDIQSVYPPQLMGFLASFGGMVVGSLAFRKYYGKTVTG